MLSAVILSGHSYPASGFFIKVDSDSALEYLVEHTSKTYVISKDGQYVNILPHDMTSGLALKAIRGGL
jgi:protein SCO1/2